MSTAQELAEQRLAEIVRYAQRKLGSDASQLSSQRALSERLGVAPTMVTRYKSGNVSFGNLRAETVKALASAAELHVGTIFVWIERGREAAMQYEARMGDELTAMEPLDLARRLVDQLESLSIEADSSEAEQPATAKPGSTEAGPTAAGPTGAGPTQAHPAIDTQGLVQRLADTRSEAPRIFDRMVRALAAEPMQQRLAYGELDPDDWQLLSELLDEDPVTLLDTYGPQRLQTPKAAAPTRRARR